MTSTFMMFQRSNKFGVFLLFLWIPNVFAIFLDIRRDGSNFFHYSAKVTIFDHTQNSLDSTDTNQISDDQMRGLVKQAYTEMQNIFTAQNVDDKERPGAMISLAVGQEIYFSSSIKKIGGFIDAFPDNPVARALTRCVINDGHGTCTNPRGDGCQHRTGASCGEPLAVYTYYQDHYPIATLPTAVRVIAWNQGNRPQAGVAAPCGQGDNGEVGKPWGCKRFLEDQKVTNVIGDGNVGDIPDDWVAHTSHSCLRG